MTDIAIKVEGLGKEYIIGHKKSGDLRNSFSDKVKKVLGRHNSFKESFWALKDISFEVKKGEAIGIIGRNGAGKSTLLKILSRITEPTKGRFEINGRVSSLLEVGTGFHMELTGRENIYLNGTILGMKRAEIKKNFDEIVNFSGVEKFLDTPVKHYSSGMKVRLAFSVAAHLEPEILIVDEVLAVGDIEFQKKCLGKMDEVSKNEGRTVIFVSHNMSAVQSLCNRGLLLHLGQNIFQDSIKKVVDSYLGYNNTTKTDLSTASYSGSGKVKFQGLRFIINGKGSAAEYNEVAQIPSGAGVTFELKVRADQLVKTYFAITIKDQYSSKVATLDNLYLNQPIAIKGDMTLTCKVAAFNLNCGSYLVDLWASDGYETLQKINEAKYFEVIENDLLNTGRQQKKEKHGFVYFDQVWEKE